MMFDLDRFKAINDTFGHAVGDVVIRKFSEAAGAALRPNDALGRIGGEEFAVAIAGSSLEAAAARAERICVSFAEDCRRVGDHWLNATVSGGVAASVNGEYALSALLEYADVALYRAKDAGETASNAPTSPGRTAGCRTFIASREFRAAVRTTSLLHACGEKARMRGLAPRHDSAVAGLTHRPGALALRLLDLHVATRHILGRCA